MKVIISDQLRESEFPEKTKNIQLHFAITLLSYMYSGFALGVFLLGVKAGLGLYTCIGIHLSSLIVLVTVFCTSMEAIKDVLYKKEDKTKITL